MTDALPQPDLSRSTSVPEELSDEDDAPTVTTSPVYDSPECPPSGPRSPLARGGLLRPSSKEAQAQIVESGDENIVSYQRSDIQEELEVEVSSTFEDQHSERLLKLEEEDSLNSQEKLSASKHVSSSMSEEHRYSSSVSLEQDTEIKKRETSEAEEAEKSNIISSSKSHSAAVDLKTSPPLSYSSASSEHSCSPDLVAFSSKKGAAIKDVEVSSPIADGYHEDFESSADSSPREERHGSKPASQISVAPTEIKGLRKDSPSRATPYDSQDEEVDEEISEELSHHSGTSGASCQSGRLLDLHNHTDNSKHDSNDIVHSSRSPPISPLHTPLSPVIDEMPSFSIGDRVLVGSVQPGTLRFKGPTSFANGFWAGVELDKSEGSNNGTYDGIVYFKCDESHGIFAPPDKITHLPDKFEIYTDTTEDEDSFCDGMSDKDGEKRKTDEHKSQKQGNLKSENDQTSNKVYESGDKKVTEESVHKIGSHLNLQHYKESKHPICNGNTRDIMLDFEDAPTTLLISDTDKIDQGKQSLKEITAIVEREEVDSHQFSPADLSTDIRDDKGEQKDRDLLDTFADKLLNNFVKDTLTQFAEIKKAKEQKIEAANQMNGYLFSENVEQEEWFSSVQQKDGLPFFLPAEKEELSSPELCNRPVSVYF